MAEHRRTAVVRFVLSGYGPDEVLALDVERAFEAFVTIDGRSYAAQRFHSPLGDEKWRVTIGRLRDATTERDKKKRRRADFIASAGNELYSALARLSPELEEFLSRSTGPRRLVIESPRPEIHALPWEAMVDNQLRSIALSGVSLVHCLENFQLSPDAAGPQLAILGAFGPGIDERTRKILQEVSDAATGMRERGVSVLDAGADAKDAAVIHIEAHGDPLDGTVALSSEESLDPQQLAARFPKKKMVLLWSCYSAMMHSWGTSPALSLHQAASTFVLSFISPLHYDASAEIAGRFYGQLLGVGGSGDAESAVVNLRAEEFRGRFEYCDWASLTVWLRQPLDLSGVPVGATRLPAAYWTNEGKPHERLRDALRNASPDRPVRVKTPITPPLPLDLVSDWGGPVVYLKCSEGLDDPEVFQKLGISSKDVPSPHPADRLLALLDRMDSLTGSLLIWSGEGSREEALLEAVRQSRKNLVVVLVDSEADAPPPRGGIDRLKDLVVREKFGEAKLLFGTLQPAELDQAGDEFWQAVYWAGVKTNSDDVAKQALLRLRAINPVEADLQEGNFLSRNGDRLGPPALYRRALETALTGRDAARARLELGYAAAEGGEPSRASDYYHDALVLLEKAPAGERDSRWTSALARALRDWADNLVEAGGDAGEIRALLRRARAIHAWHGRATHVAYCLLSEARLFQRAGDSQASEKLAADSAMVFQQSSNPHGVAMATDLLVRSLSQRSLHEQAQAVLALAASRLLTAGWRNLKPKKFFEYRSQNRFSTAEVLWRMGRACQAEAMALEACKFIEAGRLRSGAERLATLAGAGRPASPALRQVAALAGRRPGQYLKVSNEELAGRIERHFDSDGVRTLISSAAAGADLTALSVARRLAIPFWIVLPFPAAQFLETSVRDGGPEPVACFQSLVAEAETNGRLIVTGDHKRDSSYDEATSRILEEALGRVRPGSAPPLAVAVWDGFPHENDRTASFLEEAIRLGFGPREIPTV